MYSNLIAEHSSANLTFVQTASGTIRRYTLHALHARNEQRSISVDVIQITTSISGLLIAIFGLIQGYRLWKQCKENATAANNADNPTPANPNLVTIDISRVYVCLDICKFYLSQMAPAAGAPDPAAGAGNAPILAADTIELAPAAAHSIDDEERGLGPTSTAATVT